MAKENIYTFYKCWLKIIVILLKKHNLNHKKKSGTVKSFEQCIIIQLVYNLIINYLGMTFFFKNVPILWNYTVGYNSKFAYIILPSDILNLNVPNTCKFYKMYSV